MLETIVFAIVVGLVGGLVGIHFPQPPYAKHFSDWLGGWIKEKYGRGVWIGLKSILGMK